jgi:hypothetical protein
MFDRQNEALGRFLGRFPRWYLGLSQPSRGFVAALVLLSIAMIAWLEIRDWLQIIGLWPR